MLRRSSAVHAQTADDRAATAPKTANPARVLLRSPATPGPRRRRRRLRALRGRCGHRWCHGRRALGGGLAAEVGLKHVEQPLLRGLVPADGFHHPIAHGAAELRIVLEALGRITERHVERLAGDAQVAAGDRERACRLVQVLPRELVAGWAIEELPWAAAHLHGGELHLGTGLPEVPEQRANVGKARRELRVERVHRVGEPVRPLHAVLEDLVDLRQAVGPEVLDHGPGVLHAHGRIVHDGVELGHGTGGAVDGLADLAAPLAVVLAEVSHQRARLLQQGHHVLGVLHAGEVRERIGELHEVGEHLVGAAGV